MKHAQKGDTVFLRCNATGNPTPTYEWRIASNLLSRKHSITVNLSSDANFGNYSCVVRNSVGYTTHNVEVFKVGKFMGYALSSGTVEPYESQGGSFRERELLYCVLA